MDLDFLDAISQGLDECAELAGEKFTVAGRSVAADFSGATESVELSTTGGKVVMLQGTLVVSRRKLPTKPAAESIVTGPGGTRYRIHDVHPDQASWTLTLSSLKSK